MNYQIYEMSESAPTTVLGTTFIPNIPFYEIWGYGSGGRIVVGIELENRDGIVSVFSAGAAVDEAEAMAMASAITKDFKRFYIAYTKAKRQRWRMRHPKQ